MKETPTPRPKTNETVTQANDLALQESGSTGLNAVMIFVIVLVSCVSILVCCRSQAWILQGPSADYGENASTILRPKHNGHRRHPAVEIQEQITVSLSGDSGDRSPTKRTYDVDEIP